MGTARAVVAESTSCPPCNASVSNAYSRSCIFLSAVSVMKLLSSLTVHEGRYRLPQLRPIFQEGVVPAPGVYLTVANPGTRPARPFRHTAHLFRREQPVARYTNKQHLGLDAAQSLALGLVAGSHVVEVHRAREVEVGVGIEALYDVPPLVVQVALDLEAPPELGVEGSATRGPAPEALPLPARALVGHHRRHARGGEAPLGKTTRTVVVAALPVGIGHDRAPPDLAVDPNP